MKTENNLPEQNESNQDKSEPQKEKTFWQKLQEMPYSNDKIGQAFSIPWSKPESAKRPEQAHDKSNPDSGDKNHQ